MNECSWREYSKNKGKSKGNLFKTLSDSIAIVQTPLRIVLYKTLLWAQSPDLFSISQATGSVNATVMKPIAGKTKDILMIKKLTIVKGCNISKFQCGISYW